MTQVYETAQERKEKWMAERDGRHRENKNRDQYVVSTSQRRVGFP